MHAHTRTAQGARGADGAVGLSFLGESWIGRQQGALLWADGVYGPRIDIDSIGSKLFLSPRLLFLQGKRLHQFPIIQRWRKLKHNAGPRLAFTDDNSRRAKQQNDTNE